MSDLIGAPVELAIADPLVFEDCSRSFGITSCLKFEQVMNTLILGKFARRLIPLHQYFLPFGVIQQGQFRNGPLRVRCNAFQHDPKRSDHTGDCLAIE